MNTPADSTIESQVRSYCRSYPKVFVKAQGTRLETKDGRQYLDFLAGCGSLNYGHNEPTLKAALVDYISQDGIAMGLDLRTDAKAAFMDVFETHILKPRKLDYKVQFTGPTGANAVEAAIKLARKVTGRTNVVAFTNAFHGCTLGALSLTANTFNRGGSAPLLNNVHHAFFDGYFGAGVNTADMLRKQIADPSGGIDKPAAIIVELVQGEGGLNVARQSWLAEIQRIARSVGALLIIDDIQAGCGRTGQFFSFEQFGIVPDIVTMAKGISGFGLPMSLVLLRPDLDVWQPGEHNGTFRGNTHAFVTATAAIQKYWADTSFAQSVGKRSAHLYDRLNTFAMDQGFTVKGRGLMQGLDVHLEELAASVKKAAFVRGLIIECSGPHDEVIKFLPPLNVSLEDLNTGVDIVFDAINEAMATSDVVALPAQ